LKRGTERRRIDVAAYTCGGAARRSANVRSESRSGSRSPAFANAMILWAIVDRMKRFVEGTDRGQSTVPVINHRFNRASFIIGQTKPQP
jgi:hypothetical protein